MRFSLATYLNPLSRLGMRTYSFFFPFIATLSIFILIEFLHHITAIATWYSLLVIASSIALIVYFAFRDGLKGGYTVVIFTIFYYFYIIYTSHYKGVQLETSIQTTFFLGFVYAVIASVIGLLKQMIDVLIGKEQDARLLAEIERNRVNTIMQQLPVGVLVVDKKDRTFEVNDRLRKILGRGSAYPSKQWPIVRALDKGEIVSNEEIFFERPHRKPVYLRVNAAPIIDTQKRIVAAVSTLYDVTKEKEAGEKLAASEAKFRKLFDANIIGVFISKLDGTFLEANDVFLTMIEYTREDLKKGKIHRDIFTPSAYAQASENAVKSLREKGKSPVYEKEYITKSGKQIFVLIAVAMIDGSDTCVGFVVDITERKREEEAKYRLATVIASTEDAILSKTLKGIITSWNRGAEKMFGYTQEEAIGASINIIVPKHLRKLEEDIIRRLTKGEAIENLESLRLKKNGQIFPVSMSISPIANSKGVIIGIANITRDITKQKALEQQKDNFIAIASHELKTPITSLKGFTQIMEVFAKQKKDEKSLHLLEKMNNQVNKLTNLVADLLDVTKIQAGQLPLNMQSFDFTQMLQGVIESIQLTTQQHTIVLKGSINKNMYSDKERIEQVLINLLTNAIKYSPNAKKVIVTVKQVQTYIEVAVRDFGIGIPQAKQKKVFEQFFRVSGPHTATFPGLGLGLYISKEIIKRLGGKLWVESVEGKGSIFFMRLPFLTKNL